MGWIVDEFIAVHPGDFVEGAQAARLSSAHRQSDPLSERVQREKHSERWTQTRPSPMLNRSMRLYASKIPAIVDSIAHSLVDPGDIETSNLTEFKADVESILREYLRTNRDLTERSKDLLEQRGLPYSDLFRVRRQMAEDQDFGIGDDAPTWITNQLLELFMRSNFVDEIYVEDPVLRKKIKASLLQHMQHDEDLDREVRRHLKHLNEGTDSFEIEYQKQLDRVRRKHGLE